MHQVEASICLLLPGLNQEMSLIGAAVAAGGW